MKEGEKKTRKTEIEHIKEEENQTRTTINEMEGSNARNKVRRKKKKQGREVKRKRSKIKVEREIKCEEAR